MFAAVGSAIAALLEPISSSSSSSRGNNSGGSDPSLNIVNNCTANLTALTDPDEMTREIVVTAVFASLSFAGGVLHTTQNCCNRTHNIWPQSQIQWLGYFVAVFSALILAGGVWGLNALHFPDEFCQAQGMAVQFMSVVIIGWFIVITVTMWQMIRRQESADALSTKARTLALVLVLSAAAILTGVPAWLNFGYGYKIFYPNLYNTWCWISTCEWKWFQLLLLELEMMVVVAVGCVMALLALCKLWRLRRSSSQNFQPRIAIYVARRVTFILAYAVEIVMLFCTWLVPDHNLLVVDKAIVASGGILLVLAFGTPDSWCTVCRCGCVKASNRNDALKARAATYSDLTHYESR
jgi:hypothetical protein